MSSLKFPRTIALALAVGVTGVFAADIQFIGESGSYSGDISTADNWGGTLPTAATAVFNESGDLTASSSVAFPNVYFQNASRRWSLSDFGSDLVLFKDLVVKGGGSHLALTNGTLTIDKINGATAHIYIGNGGGGAGDPNNILEVGKDATLLLNDGSLRIGGYAGFGTTDAPGNTFLVSEGGTFKSKATVRLGDGNHWGYPGCRLETRGAKLFELSNSQSLQVGCRTNAFDNVASFRDTEKVSIYSVNVASFPSATNCALLADSVPDFSITGSLTMNYGAKAELLNGGKLSLKNVTLSSGSSFRVSNVTDTCSLVGNPLRLSSGSRAEFRDIAMLTLPGVVLTNAALFVSNVTELTSSDSIRVGSSAGGASAELHMPPAFNPRTVVMNSGATGKPNTLVYDAGGATITNTSFTAFVTDNNANANVTVELRNGNYWIVEWSSGQTQPNPLRYRVSGAYHKYVIGPGATLSMPEVRYGSAIYQEGQKSAYGARADGVAIVIDGGTMRLAGSTGGYNIGSSGYGEGNIFQVKNNGLLWCDQTFAVGAESGVADSCEVLVASGGEIKAKTFNMLTSNNRVVISNGTFTISGSCSWPTSNSCWPNNEHFGEKQQTPREATNNVVRFEGPDAHLVADGVIGGYLNTKTPAVSISTTLSFAVPEEGYDSDNPPIQAGTGVRFEGTLKIQVDPTAYGGERKWMTVMKTTSGNITFANLDTSELSEGVKTRFKDSSTRKEFQIRVGKPRGLAVILR